MYDFETINETTWGYPHYFTSFISFNCMYLTPTRCVIQKRETV